MSNWAKDNSATGLQLVGSVALLVFIALLWCGTNTDREEARRVLQDQGLREVHVGGWAGPVCGDWQCTEFKAVNTDGRHVSGAVGCGLVFKACTVRWSR
jgi:hypothetical protein